MLYIWFVSAFHKVIMHNTSENILYLHLICLLGCIFRKDWIIMLVPSTEQSCGPAPAKCCLVVCWAALWSWYNDPHFFKMRTPRHKEMRELGLILDGCIASTWQSTSLWMNRVKWSRPGTSLAISCPQDMASVISMVRPPQPRSDPASGETLY